MSSAKEIKEFKRIVFLNESFQNKMGIKPILVQESYCVNNNYCKKLNTIIKIKLEVI